MNTTASEPRGPGRPRKTENRAEEVKAQRRRRDDFLTGGRLGVDPALLDHETYEYRYLNDEPGRIISKTKHDDWDLVSNDGGVVKADATGFGDVVSTVVGRHPDGSPKMAYLARKLKKFYQEDAAKAQTEIDRHVEQLRRGNTRDGASQGDYVPTVGIRID